MDQVSQFPYLILPVVVSREWSKKPGDPMAQHQDHTLHGKDLSADLPKLSSKLYATPSTGQGTSKSVHLSMIKRLGFQVSALSIGVRSEIMIT